MRGDRRRRRMCQTPAVLAGGCFWGVQAVFQHVKGVETAVSGYSGGEEATAHYQTVMRTTIRELNFRHLTQLSLVDIARRVNPLLRGWIEYYGRYAPSALYPLLRYVNQTLRAWMMRKFKRFAGHKIRAGRFLERLARHC